MKLSITCIRRSHLKCPQGTPRLMPAWYCTELQWSVPRSRAHPTKMMWVFTNRPCFSRISSCAGTPWMDPQWPLVCTWMPPRSVSRCWSSRRQMAMGSRQPCFARSSAAMGIDYIWHRVMQQCKKWNQSQLSSSRGWQGKRKALIVCSGALSLIDSTATL